MSQDGNSQREIYAKELLQEHKVECNQSFSLYVKLENLLKKAEHYSHFLFANHKAETGTSSCTKTPAKRRQSIDKFEVAHETAEPVPTRLTHQPTILKGGELKGYQLDGLNWLIGLYEANINGILADEMGLGKTIQMIAFLAYLREACNLNRHFLIIAPKNVLSNWKKEFSKWLPDIKVVKMKATKEERIQAISNELIPGLFDVCLTTYQGIQKAFNHLKKIDWEYIIIDEAHSIKNEETALAQSVRSIKTKHRLLMTGTPLQNNLHELWALLNYILPDMFVSSEEFEQLFNFSQIESKTEEEKEQANFELVKKLHKILRPFICRRTKAEVEKDLPPKTEIHISVTLTDLQKKLYKDLLLKSMIEDTDSYYKNTLIQLRKVCCHPYLFKDVESKDLPLYGEHIVEASGKLKLMDKLLTKLLNKGSKALIFSQFSTMLDIIDDYLVYRKIDFCRIDGDTDYDLREKQMEEFNEPSSPKKVFILTTRAGGLGINLIGADVVIIYDSDFNPQVDLQAMDRAHRIGQTKPVSVFRLITENTIEEKIIERQVVRLKLDTVIIQQGRVQSKNTFTSKEDLKKLIQCGANEVIKGTSKSLDQDVEKLIENGIRRAHELNKTTEDKIKNEFNLKSHSISDFNVLEINVFNFENEDYKKKREEERKSILEAMNEYLTNKRETDKVRYNIEEYFNRALNLQKPVKIPKSTVKLYDFQFFSKPDRLKDLLRKEELYIKKTKLNKDCPKLTPEEEVEKSELLKSGFPNVKKREYNAFVEALKKYGRNSYDKIAEEIGNMTAAEVESYSKVYWANIDKIENADKVAKLIEKKEKTEENLKKITQMIENKIKEQSSIYDAKLKYIKYEPESPYNPTIDSALLFYCHRQGYGKWHLIKAEIINDPTFRYNSYIKSRNIEDIKNRIDLLVRYIEKELGGEEVKKENNKRSKNEPLGSAAKKLKITE